ncbi:MAG: ACT domain-containing protein [Solirubrobacterales bacterium]|nr:ACT domain-containing protein [Solirubrobacterales bacterium]
MAHYAVTAVGRDRPGIVAALTRELLALDANLADSQMSIMRGHFAVMLVADLPETASPAQLAAGLDRVRDELSLDTVQASRLDPAASERPEPSHVLSVYGADHPGIVHSVSTVLARLGVNVTGLETRLVGSEESPLYAMILELELGGASESELRAGLGEAAGDGGLEVSLRELDAEAL